MAVAFNAVWQHASYKNRLLDTKLDPRLFERVHKRYQFGPLIYRACFTLGSFSVPLSLGMIAMLALLYALPYGDEARAIEERFRRFHRNRGTAR